MHPKEYIQAAIKTKSDQFHPPYKWKVEHHDGPDSPIDILHSIIGISTEAGELLDAVKKSMFYGKQIDYVNLDEEIGDVLWYIAIYCNARNITIERLMQTNIDKLKARYPDKFTTDNAVNRNLEKERMILERMGNRYRPGTEP